MTNSDSVNISGFFLYNFDSFCLILFIFTPHHYHQTVHVWKENRGWRMSITRVKPLCNSNNKMFVLWLIVHTLWNQLLLELLLDLFNTLQICYRHIEDVHEEVWCYKNIFWQTYGVFNLSHFQTTAPSKLWLIVHTLWNQLLLQLSLNLFSILQICYRHIEDVHEGVWCWKNIF